MAFRDPRDCLRDFFQTGRNLGQRPPSFSLRNVQRDIRAVSTSIENIGRRIEGTIGAVARGDFLPGQALSIANVFRCPPTNYVNYFTQHRPPKFKFMFFVEMELHPDFFQAFGEPWSEGEVWWFAKEVDRPQVNYTYEEVNMYNFRTKVVTRATFEPLSMTMYDDLKDVTNGFWNTYLRIMSPITNVSEDLDEFLRDRNGMEWENNNIYNFNQVNGLPNIAQIRSKLAADEGFAATPNPPTQTYSAGTGTLPGNTLPFEIIKTLRVHHIIDWGSKAVSYIFKNVRIENIQMDELTWDSSEPSVIEVQFSYDAFEISYPRLFTESSLSGAKIPPVYPINPQYDEFPFGLG